MTATAPRNGLYVPTTDDTVCWDCSHEVDEHIGTGGSCIAYVIQFGRENFCPCRNFVPDSP